MITDSAQDLHYIPEESKPLVAVFPHPLHGRLIERVIAMVTSRLEFGGFIYRLSWRDRGVAFYAPADSVPQVQPRTRKWDLAFEPD
jgi:hypothetical protein